MNAISRPKSPRIERLLSEYEAPCAKVVTDKDYHILHVNEAFTEITGYSADEAIGATPRILRSGMQDEKFYADMKDSLQQYQSWEGEIWNCRKNGELYPCYLQISVALDMKGRVSRYYGTAIDLSAYKSADEKRHSLTVDDATLERLPSAFAFHDGREVLARFRAMEAMQASVVLIPENVSGSLVTTIKGIDEASRKVRFAMSLEPSINQRLMGSQNIVFRTNLRGIRCQCHLDRMKLVIEDDVPYLEARLPSILYWLQFRKENRVGVGAGEWIRCLVPTGKATPSEFTVRELSRNGIVLSASGHPQQPELSVGQSFEACRLYLQGFNQHPFSLELRHIEHRRVGSQREAEKWYGFRFTEMSSGFRREYEKLLLEISGLQPTMAETSKAS